MLQHGDQNYGDCFACFCGDISCKDAPSGEQAL